MMISDAPQADNRAWASQTPFKAFHRIPRAVIFEIAAKFKNFQTLARFSRVCRLFRAVIDEWRTEILALHTTTREVYTSHGIPAIEHHVYGYLHCLGDQPAELWENGTEFWYRGGLVHRDGDLPAVTWYGKEDTIRRAMVRGSAIDFHPAEIPKPHIRSQSWYQNGERHRDGDRPAEVCANGDKYWYQHGELHRDGGKPAKIAVSGLHYWVVRGVLVAEVRDGSTG
jgi:hypothetical protein